MDERRIPTISSYLKRNMIHTPVSIEKASGIRVNGKLIRSLVFSTDVAIIKNINADAVMAVYPFTPQPVITQAIMTASNVPVFCGVGGGITTGKRAVNLALHAEFQGAMGVVVNAPTSNEVISEIVDTIDIPVVVTVTTINTHILDRIKAGASILNVSGASKTPDIVALIRKDFPDIPIIATGGPTEESILRTIEAGANAITYTPPTSAELFSALMEKYRGEL
ncbi:hydrolase [Proteiniborus sp.]|uniref:hydrolase n=1 Tax=Proteiniborus sp. TaxID=2079015 RepID=UPI0033213081